LGSISVACNFNFDRTFPAFGRQGAPLAKEKKKEAAATVELPVVYDFWAKWCVPCKVIKPIFEEVEQEYKGKVDMKAIDFDESKQQSPG